MKKKIVSICTLLTLLAVFFCVPVHAENTYVRQLRNYSNSISSVSLTYSATAAQFDYVTESTLSGGMYSPVLITVRFTNNGSNDIKIANSYVDLTFTTYSEVSGYDCYTSDLMVQMVKNGNDTPRYNIVASNGYSYGGHIVVPALSSLYLVFEVDIAAHYDTSSAQVVSPSLDAVLVSVNASDVTAGDYPTSGSIPEQLDELETYVAQLSGYTYANGQSLANIATMLVDIKNQIRFTGTFTPFNPSLYSSTAKYEDVTSYTNIYSLSERATVYPPYIISKDFELSGSNVYQDGFKRYVYVIGLEIIATNPVAYGNFNVYPQYVSSNSIAGYVVDVKSNFVGSVGGTRQTLVLQSNMTYQRKYVIPAGKNYVTITMYIDVPLNTDVTFRDLSTLTNNITAISTMESVTSYYPHSLDQGVGDLYNAITSPSQQNTDTGNASDAAAELSDDIHEQEEIWYDQNSAAMEAVGLSSYRFTNQQASGILGVTTQFEQLWLSLGNWTLIYIFVLMLSLATFILRHEPSTRVKQLREQYNTDREVRLGWERINNPNKAHYRQLVERHRK